MADSLENQYDNDKFVDYYNILQVEIDADVGEIKKKYIDLAKKYHPDQKNGNSEMFQKISKAYDVLSNKNTRKEYDLYFLKQNSEEFKENTFLSLKEQFTDFIETSDNKKKFSKDELDKIYNDVFKDRENFKEKILDDVETNKRINDINFEREATNIETLDEQLKNIIESNPNLEIGEILEFIKETNKKTSGELIKSNIDTLDMLPGFMDFNYSSFDDDTQNTPSNFFTLLDNNNTNSKELVKTFTVENFNEWKENRNTNAKLDNNDIDTYLAKRKEEELNLLNEVQVNLLSNIKKRTDVETFLKPKDKTYKHINNEDIMQVETLNNVKKRNT